MCVSVLLTCRAVVCSFASEEQERFVRDGSLSLFVTLRLTFFSHTINIGNDQTLILDIYCKKKKKNSLPSWSQTMLRQVLKKTFLGFFTISILFLVCVLVCAYTRIVFSPPLLLPAAPF